MITDKKVYKDLALPHVKDYASSHSEFLMEDVGEFAKAAGLDDPQETRWWGGIAHAAKAAGYIESTGTFRICSKGKGNPRYMMVWRSKLI
jgi:hypothetical protein